MIPAGFMRKKVLSTPEWIKSKDVVEIASVSSCLSDFAFDYIDYWCHNGFWLFNSVDELDALMSANGHDRSGSRLFYYELYEQEFEDADRVWMPIEPVKSLPLNVEPPARARLLGYDVVRWQSGPPECSPLSCNSLADEVEVNQYCLLPTLDRAMELLESGFFEDAEPGPYRIAAVWEV